MSYPEDIHRAIGRLEAKVDILLERSEASEKERELLAERISKLEHGATAQKAAVGVIATITGAASAYAAKLFGGQ